MEGISTVIRSPEELDRQLAAVNRDARSLIQHGPVIVTVGSFHSKRTIEQNNMWRGLCREIAKQWNERENEKTSADAIARDLKVKYGIIVTEYSPVTDERSARLESTLRYTKAKMSDLIDNTLAWAFEHNIILEDPRC